MVAVAVAVAVGVALATGGCATRSLVAAPEHEPGRGGWTAVWLAGTLAAGLAGVLLARPGWPPRRRARLAVGVLTLQTGAVAVAGAVLTGVAVRTWQLLERPGDASPATALVRISRVDGDRALSAAIVGLLVIGTVLVVALSALAARFVSSDDGWERGLASALLAAEVGGAAYAAGRLLLGAHGWPFLGPTLALPLLAAAFVASWPTRRDRPPLAG